MSASFVCHLCSFRAFDPAVISRHYSSAHQASFSCRFCYQQFLTYRNAQAHENTQHADSDQNLSLQCFFCPHRSVSRVSFDSHHRLRHPAELRHCRCPECAILKSSALALATHRRFCHHVSSTDLDLGPTTSTPRPRPNFGPPVASQAGFLTSTPDRRLAGVRAKASSEALRPLAMDDSIVGSHPIEPEPEVAGPSRLIPLVPNSGTVSSNFAPFLFNSASNSVLSGGTREETELGPRVVSSRSLYAGAGTSGSMKVIKSEGVSRDGKLHGCVKCDKPFFADLSARYMHFSKHHYPFAFCMYCGTCEDVQFWGSEALQLYFRHHNAQHHYNCSSDPNKSLWGCLICQKSYYLQKNLWAHLRSDHPADFAQLKCTLCFTVLPSPLCVQVHMKDVHRRFNVEESGSVDRPVPASSPPVDLEDGPITEQQEPQQPITIDVAGESSQSESCSSSGESDDEPSSSQPIQPTGPSPAHFEEERVFTCKLCPMKSIHMKSIRVHISRVHSVSLSIRDQYFGTKVYRSERIESASKASSKATFNSVGVQVDTPWPDTIHYMERYKKYKRRWKRLKRLINNPD